MEDDHVEDSPDDFEEESEHCRTCDSYQQQIHVLNARLRANLRPEEYQKAKQQLDELVQLQLKHQREHL